MIFPVRESLLRVGIVSHSEARGRLIFSGSAWKGPMGMDKPKNDNGGYHQGITMHKIPVEGIVGFLFVFATVFIFVVGIPEVRGLALVAGFVGILGSGFLYYWRSHKKKKFQSLHLDS
ncbi:MAG: hypothetical protein ABSC02_06745 [Acidobacteriota bacterium]